MVEWVEVKGKSVEVAVKAALEELGIESEARAEVKVLQAPQRGFLGIGRQDAIVRVKPGPKRRRRSRGGRKRKPKGGAGGEKARASGGGRRESSASGSKAPQRRSASKQATGGSRSRRRKKRSGRTESESEVKAVSGGDRTADVLGQEQAEVVKGFLGGLLEEFGLEGEVETRFDGKILHANVIGDQTAALIGSKARVMQAVHELTKTVVQRKTARNCRLRLDIAGYGERRRRALSIYAGDLAEQVIEEGGEIMLEPMNAADRKVVHDAIASVQGVRSYSEGTEPRRSVVIAQQ